MRKSSSTEQPKATLWASSAAAQLGPPITSNGRALVYSRSFTAIRLLFLPAFVWAGFIAYGYSLEALGDIIPTPKEGSFVFGTLLAQGFLAAAVISILFCYPLAFLYRKSAVTVAMVMSLPVLLLRLPELIAFDRHPIAIAISAYEVLAYGVLLVVGAWLAHSHLLSANIGQKLDRNA